MRYEEMKNYFVLEKQKKMKSAKEIDDNYVARQVLVAIGPIIITLVLGQTEGYSSIILPQLEHENSTIKVNTQLSSMIASSSAVPMAAGCLLGGYLMEKIGRRAIHIWSCIPLVLGWFLIAAATNSTFILIGRFLTGISDGLLGPPTGVYIAETSHPKIRGILIMSTCVAIAGGLFSVHLLGTFLSWRMTALICGILPIPMAILMFFVPESPTYLVKMKRIEDAKQAFYWCRGKSKESQKELEELILRQEELNNAPKVSVLEQLKGFSKPEFWKPTIIISVLFFTAQITGNNAMASYSIRIIKECGLSGETFNEYFAMIIMDSFRLVAAVMSCIFVSTMTRRSLTMLSGYGVSVMLLLLCSYLFLAARTSIQSSTFLLVALTGYAFFIAVGLIPLSWTMMGEVFPLAYRGLGTAISSLVCYSVLYLVVQTFPYLLEAFGNICGVFAFYGVCTLSGTIFLTLFLPETKNKPLYVIEDNFKPKKDRRRASTCNNIKTISDIR